MADLGWLGVTTVTWSSFALRPLNSSCVYRPWTGGEGQRFIPKALVSFAILRYIRQIIFGNVYPKVMFAKLNLAKRTKRFCPYQLAWCFAQRSWFAFPFAIHYLGIYWRVSTHHSQSQRAPHDSTGDPLKWPSGVQVLPCLVAETFVSSTGVSNGSWWLIGGDAVNWNCHLLVDDDDWCKKSWWIDTVIHGESMRLASNTGW